MNPLIIGLGEIGCNIARKLAQFPQYDIITFDSEMSTENYHNIVPKFASIEDYDNLVINFKLPKAEEITLCVSGANIISGLSLRLLEAYKNNKIDILYIKPDLELISEYQRRCERVIRNVLQEYARSAKFNKIILVDNSQIEHIIGDVPIKQYYDRINEVIVSAFHMLNVFNHTDAIKTTISKPLDINRIETIGYWPFEEKTEKMFFLLDKADECCYYYAINEKRIDEDASLLRKIKFNLNPLGQEKKISYAIYSSNHQEDVVYCTKFTSKIQD